LKSDIEKLQRDKTGMSEKKKKALQDKVIKQQEDFQKLQISYQTDFIKARDKALSGLFKEVKGVVEKIAKKENFDLVLTSEPVAYANDDLDITSLVVKALPKS